ncbi:MAG: hypothetical protein HYW25_05025 [Candidatus Aenigmarchaeota archaeon]|nr:hypothetical protein [Candidatus Aenigmarchaeota archaeon]
MANVINVLALLGILAIIIGLLINANNSGGAFLIVLGVVALIFVFIVLFVGHTSRGGKD